MPVLHAPDARPSLSTRGLLRWVYLGRLLLVVGLFGMALLGWLGGGASTRLVAAVMFGVGVAVTAGSFWHTHLREREAPVGFLYLQVLVDLLLLTAAVHITGGATSDLPPLYILVVAAGALLLPLSGGVLIGVLASTLFFGDIVLLQDGPVTAPLLLQGLLFSAVAVIIGLLGDRLRRAGLRLGAVESELRQLRLDTTEILDNLTTGVVTVDEEGRLAYLNQAGARLLGLEGQAPPGAPIRDLLEDSAPAMGRLLLRAVRERVPVRRFRAILDRDHRQVVLGVSTTVTDGSRGGTASATAVFQDITHAERMEILDRRNQRLQAVAELSASLAHEIKNPLASIRSSVEQLSGDGLESDDREVLQRLVLSESDRLSRLLSEFLEFSALRKGETHRLDLAGVTRDAVRLAQAHPEAGDDVEVVCSGLGEPFHIPGDSDLLHRVLFNLVLNALQFAGPGGRVEVTLADHREGAPPEPVEVDRPVRITIRDDGPGIDEADAPRIFDPFYTTRNGGSGLGLAVAYRAVEAHKGVILAGNAPGGGAEFTLYLPGDEAADE